MVQSAIVKKQVREGVVQVSLLRQVECGLSCSGNCAGCMQKPEGELLALASDPIGTRPGERVEVEPSTGHSIALSVLVFALPCVFLALGYILSPGNGRSALCWDGWHWSDRGLPAGCLGEPGHYPQTDAGICDFKASGVRRWRDVRLCPALSG